MAGPLPPLINRTTNFSGTWAEQWRYGVPGQGTWSSRNGTVNSFTQVVYKDRPKRSGRRPDFTYPPKSWVRNDLVASGLRGQCYYEHKFGAVGANRYQNLMSGTCAPSPSWTQVFPSGSNWSLPLYDEALNTMYGNLSNTKVQLGVMLAELGKGISMMEKNAIRMLKSWKWFCDMARLRNPKIRMRYLMMNRKSESFLNSSRFIRDAWLEMVFGWEPLLLEVQGFSEALAEMATAGYVPELSCRGWAVREYVQPYTVNLQGLPTGAVRVNLPMFERCLFTSVWRVDTDPSAQWMGLLGLSNPMADLWEVTPLSCIVDYVLPIGNAFNGMAAAQGLTFKEGTLTRSRVVDQVPGNPRKKRKPAPIDVNPYIEPNDANMTLASLSGLHGYVCGIKMERNVLNFPPLPPMRLPDLYNGLGARRLANVLAVLSSITDGRSPPTRT